MSRILRTIIEQYGVGNVKVRDPQKVNLLLEKFAADDTNAFQVIADFDLTLTPYHHNGRKCENTHGLLCSSPIVSDGFKKKAGELYGKYYPIEINQNMSVEKKIPMMLRWCEEYNENLITFPLSQQQLSEIIKDSHIVLRNKTQQMLERLHQHKIPLLIFSAGVGDVVRGILQKFNAYHFTTTIIANFMKFDGFGKSIGFEQPFIHACNKKESLIHQVQPDYFVKNSGRPNVLILGDSLGDAHMVDNDGVGNTLFILKIGFLNTMVEDNLQSYMNAFDIVIVEDQSASFVLLLLKNLFSSF